MRIAIVSDAWSPQVNGVVTTLQQTANELQALGQTVRFYTPEGYRTIPCPTYPSIRFAVRPKPRLWRELDAFAPEALHIATEGPLGLSARRYAIHRSLLFTTSYHTQFPEYLRLRAPVPLAVGYRFMRWFHSAAECTLVPTRSQRDRLAAHGLRKLAIWERGVDTELFRPTVGGLPDAGRPVALYAGRVAVEKNIGAFLDMAFDGSKHVVGDGPALPALRERYPDVCFHGFKFGEELTRLIAAADVFVFPSRTDTFGLVLLEALACGVPVAAYPVTGPIDVIDDGVTGALDEDLAAAAGRALTLDPVRCRAAALRRSWRASTEQFLANLVPNRRACW